MTVQVFTASWSALHRAAKAGTLDVEPVRISRGGPRFWPEAREFPAISELMPEGWVLGLRDDPFFEAYREKLDRISVEAITAALDAIPGGKLALACFEADPAACHRGPRGFAGYWFEKTGVRIEEWEPPNLAINDSSAPWPGSQLHLLDQPTEEGSQ